MAKAREGEPHCYFWCPQKTRNHPVQGILTLLGVKCIISFNFTIFLCDKTFCPHFIHEESETKVGPT